MITFHFCKIFFNATQENHGQIIIQWTQFFMNTPDEPSTTMLLAMILSITFG